MRAWDCPIGVRLLLKRQLHFRVPKRRKPNRVEPILSTNIENAPSRRLSSVLTPVWKVLFAGALLVTGILFTYQSAKHLPVDAGFVVGIVISWAAILWLVRFCVRLKKVMAVEDHLVVSGYFATALVPYEDIDEIKAYRGRSEVYVRLRLRNACRFGQTIHFLLPSIIASVAEQPEVQLLREKCPQLTSESKSRWRGIIYLRRSAAV